MSESPQHATVFDSGVQYLAGVYARALLNAAEKTGAAEAVSGELDSVLRDVLEKIPNLEATLTSPRVPFADKERILDKAFGGKMSPTLLNFLKVLARRNRFECLRAVRRALRKLLNELRHRVEVEVRSAVALEPETLGRVAGRLKEVLGREVDVEAKVDPNLIGGLVVRVGDTVYDGSVANHLVRLREQTIRKSTDQMRQRSERFIAAEKS